MELFKFFLGKSYFTRGALIGFSVSVFFLIANLLFGGNIFLAYFSAWMPGYMIIFGLSFFLGAIGVLIGFLIIMILYALLGGFFGWIYGKNRILFLISLIIFLTLVYASRNFMDNEPYHDYSIEDCDNDDLEDAEKDLCYIKVGQQSGDISACHKVKQADRRDAFCTWSVALDKKDRAICEEIEDNILRYECFQRIGLDISVCGAFPDSERANCYTGFAAQMDDYRICDKIEILDLKKICCEKIGEYDENLKNSCLGK